MAGERQTYLIEQAFGLLCEAGIASMAELLDPRGVWTIELVETMLPVALAQAADRAEVMFGATAAAVSMIGGPKGARTFTDGLKKTRDAATAMMRVHRGLPPKAKERPKPGESAAEQFMSIMEKLGIRPPRKAKSKKPTPTRKH